MKNLCVGWAQSMLRVWSPLPRLYQRPLGEDSSVLRPDTRHVIRQGRRGWQRRQEGPRANWGLGKQEASESSHTSPFQLSPSQGPLLFSRSVVSNSAAPGTAVRRASLSFTISQSFLHFMSVESVKLSNHLIFCCPLLLLVHICILETGT